MEFIGIVPADDDQGHEIASGVREQIIVDGKGRSNVNYLLAGVCVSVCVCVGDTVIPYQIYTFRFVV